MAAKKAKAVTQEDVDSLRKALYELQSAVSKANRSISVPYSEETLAAKKEGPKSNWIDFSIFGGNPNFKSLTVHEVLTALVKQTGLQFTDATIEGKK